MKYKIALLIFSLIFFTEIKSQNLLLKKENSDLSGAIEITKNRVGPTTAPVDYGYKMEINSTKSNPKSIEKEHHTVWYKFNPEKNCILEFDIIPVSENDDYDFMLFESESKNAKSLNELQLLITNKSRNNKEIGKLTGLSTDYKNKYVGEGINPTYSKAIRVNPKKTYYLLLDNVYENGKGHSLNFKYSDCKEVQKEENKNFVLNINIIDKDTKQKVNADITLIERNKDGKDTIKLKNTNSIIKPIDTMIYFDLIIKSDNYLTHKELFRHYGRKKTLNKTIELQKISKGDSLIIDDIYFYGGLDKFKPESRPALRNLLILMKNNPDLVVEIHGHVNNPYNTRNEHSEEYYQDLSERRAEAVYYYLVKRGIDESRLSYQGFGYSKMLFPYAKTSEEQQKNRRVEMIIVDF